MNPRGEDTASAVREWVKEDIKNGPSSKGELGRFFFGVSSGTLGLLPTLLKFAVEKPDNDLLTKACFSVLLISSFVAIYMAKPHILRLTENTDLYVEYSLTIHSIKRYLFAWYALWFIGFILGITKLFTHA